MISKDEAQKKLAGVQLIIKKHMEVINLMLKYMHPAETLEPSFWYQLSQNYYIHWCVLRPMEWRMRFWLWVHP